MKTITFFITTMSSGGAEHQLAMLSSFLLEKKYSISIVTYGDVSDHYELDSKIKRIHLAAGKSKFIKYLSIILFFLRLKTDCVISFGQRENFLCLFPLYFRKKIKVIAGERNYSEGKFSFIEFILGYILYRRADYIVPNNKSQSRYLKSRYPKIKEKIIVIINYTDVEKFTVSKLPLKSQKSIGIFGRYSTQKNCLRFIEMVKMLKDKIGATFFINWYGNKYYKGSVSNYYIQMQELISKYDLCDVISLNNHVKNVKDLMLNFDAICLPSLYEGFSNSIAEGICCGKPMLVSNVSDNSTMVHEGINGFLFDPTSVEDMCNKFLKFLSLPNDCLLLMAENSRAIALEVFDKGAFVNSYIELIEH